MWVWSSSSSMCFLDALYLSDMSSDTLQVRWEGQCGAKITELFPPPPPTFTLGVNNEVLSVFRLHLTTSGKTRCKQFECFQGERERFKGVSPVVWLGSFFFFKELLSLSAVVGAPCSLKSPEASPFEIITRYLSGQAFYKPEFETGSSFLHC